MGPVSHSIHLFVQEIFIEHLNHAWNRESVTNKLDLVFALLLFLMIMKVWDSVCESPSSFKPDSNTKLNTLEFNKIAWKQTKVHEVTFFTDQIGKD